MSAPLIGFAGMTHLGINSLAAAADRHFSVLGFDGNEDLIDRLRQFKMPVVEPGLYDLLATNADRLQFSADPADLKRCDIVYISADVPTDDHARSDLSPIRSLIDQVTAHLNDDAVLVILCQVPPGFTRSLTRIPQQRLIYQVETLIFGRAVERAMHPERFIVGCTDPSLPLPACYQKFLESFSCPILPMRYESAELAKISINFCLVASVTVANVLAEVSETIGADWSEIVPALKLDKRIGNFAYLAPGLGISGGNLERDLRTVINIGKDKGTDVRVVEAWIDNSLYRKDWCWRVLSEHVLTADPKARIAVLGLAYKENTHSTKNSPSLALLAHLEGYNVRVHDPVVSSSVVPFAKGFTDPLECVAESDALVITTPWPQYKNFKISDLSRLMAGRTIIDPFRLIDGHGAAAAGFAYYTLGMSPMLPQSNLNQ